MTKDSGIEILIDHLQEMACAQCGAQMNVSALEPFSGVECPSCGNQDTVPARFGQFLLLNLINTGGMGGVYRARDESLGRLVAVKVMLKKLGENAEFVENFKREAQAAARLNHPNVAQIYSYGQVQGQPYIVMELVSGHRFDRLIETSPGGLDPAMVLRIAIDIADGLKAAGEIGLVHGDIKPENILLDEKRKAKLVDFGIASFQDQAASEGVWGTPYYIAPEKALGRKSDERSDIFSLGATLFYALTGHPPFEGETPLDVVKARLTQSPPALDTVRPELTKALAETVQRMLAREPAQRHPTYASLLGDFRRNLDELGGASGGGTLGPGGTGKRIILKRKEPVAGSVGSPSGRALPPRSSPVPMVEEKRAAERAKRLRTLWISLGIVGAVAIAIVVVVALGARRARIRDEAEARQKTFLIQQSMAQIAGLHADVLLAATNTMKRLTEFDPLLASARGKFDALAALAPGGVGSTPPPAADPAGGSTNAAAPVAAPQVDQARAVLARIEQLALVSSGAGVRVMLCVATANVVRASITNEAAMPDAAAIEADFRAQQAQIGKEDRLIVANLAEARQQETRFLPLERALRQDQQKREQEAVSRRIEQERLAAIQAERDAVKAAAERGDRLVARLALKDAFREIRTTERTLKTDDGKQAMAVVNDRYKRVESLLAFMIEELNKRPYAWGWVRPGNVREDVLGAEDRGVKLRGRVESWGQVSQTQFLALVEHCTGAKDLRRSAQAQHYLATAIYATARGDAAVAAAYREKALAGSSAIRGDVERLLGAN